MDVSDYIGFVAAEGELFASAAEQGELNVRIAACPDWNIRDLVRHLGMIHLWAAANVAFPEPDWLDVEELPDLVRYWPDLAGESGEYPGDTELVGWYRDTLANLIEVLKSAPADVAAFTFLPAPSPLAMWARRQASEIAIHRFDAELARGITSHFDPQFATDMLDELVSGFGPRPRPLDVARPQVIHVHAHDTQDDWYVTLGPERTDTSRDGDAAADLTITGTAADLYVLLWNRTPDSSVAMSGDTDLIDLWHGNFRVRWSEPPQQRALRPNASNPTRPGRALRNWQATTPSPLSVISSSNITENPAGSVEDLEVEPTEVEPTEKAAHPLELFFDLVFVFAITQVVSLVVHDLTLAGVLRGALLLALMWWAWTNWTWTTNVVDLEPRILRVAVLASMLGVFGMAFAVPTAFEGDGLWLALGYLWVRLIPAAVFIHGTRHDPAELRAVVRYLPISLAATVVVVIGGAVGGEALQWIWVAALCIELLATASVAKPTGRSTPGTSPNGMA